jgi:hypothetical protein
LCSLAQVSNLPSRDWLLRDSVYSDALDAGLQAP